mmetsp:Transcript_10799/g.25982  ORF Transcript_10799/g.25982 Transcript_10799/m.25982 type:complete len:124 (-) Transcript_10799:757-1128(-)
MRFDGNGVKSYVLVFSMVLEAKSFTTNSSSSKESFMNNLPDKVGSTPRQSSPDKMEAEVRKLLKLGLSSKFAEDCIRSLKYEFMSIDATSIERIRVLRIMLRRSTICFSEKVGVVIGDDSLLG